MLTSLGWTVFVLRDPLKTWGWNFQSTQGHPWDGLQVVEHAVPVLTWIVGTGSSLQGPWKLDSCASHVFSDKSSCESQVQSIDRISKRSKCAYEHLPGVGAIMKWLGPPRLNSFKKKVSVLPILDWPMFFAMVESHISKEIRNHIRCDYIKNNLTSTHMHRA